MSHLTLLPVGDAASVISLSSYRRRKARAADRNLASRLDRDNHTSPSPVVAPTASASSPGVSNGAVSLDDERAKRRPWGDDAA